MKKIETKNILRLIMQIGHHLKMRIDKKLSQNNLTVSQFKVLAFLWEHDSEKINQKQIHEFLEIRPSSMTKLVKLLETKDLIKKEADTDDSRNKIIKLTAKGMEIKRICIHNMNQSESYLLKDFTQQEIDALIQLLLKIKEKIKN
jgi:MarR family transcriptional regulator, repressor for mepA